MRQEAGEEQTGSCLPGPSLTWKGSHSGLLVWQTVEFRFNSLPCGAYIDLRLSELARNGLFPGGHTVESRVVMGRHQGNGGSRSWRVRRHARGQGNGVFISLKEQFCLRLANVSFKSEEDFWALVDVTWPANLGGRIHVPLGCCECQ